MRIAIVHNNPDSIKQLRQLICDLGYDVCWSCETGQQALLNHQQDMPDLLLASLEITDMGGSELIRQIMQDSTTTIIATCPSVKDNTAKVFQAMSYGALDALSEPRAGNEISLNDFKTKLSNIKKLHDSANRKPRSRSKQTTTNVPLVAIGASTGGPGALLTILKQLPADSPASFVIIQHMDDEFSQGLANWLNEQTDISVEIAQAGTRPMPGHAYMAGSNEHLIIDEDGYLAYTHEPVDYPYRPSVNAFFESAVAHWPNRLIGVLLTGMGRDGANGLLSFYNRGMLTIAQSRQSSAVYGMPRAACEIGAVTKQLDINDIAAEILNHLE
jgi:two-component system response regulator WspF